MEFRIKEGNDAYKVTAEIISKIVKKIYKDDIPGDLIVRMAAKDPWEDTYQYENVLLYVSCLGDDYSMWGSDWHEGETDISINGFTPVDNVTIEYAVDVLPGKVCKALSGTYAFKEIDDNDILKNFEDLVEVIK